MNKIRVEDVEERAKSGQKVAILFKKLGKCPPCERVWPRWLKLAETQKDVQFHYCEISEPVDELGVFWTPSILLYESGQIISRFEKEASFEQFEEAIAGNF